MSIKQFIMVRGHQGSGKSTFAKTKIDEFLEQHPTGTVVHLENDKYMMEYNPQTGQEEYKWTKEKLTNAINSDKAIFLNTITSQHTEPVLIINSNTNQKASNCEWFINSAKKHGFTTHVYRCANFYQNEHNVKDNDVIQAYIKLNQNPVIGEINVKVTAPPNAEQQAKIDYLMNLERNILPYDNDKNTFVTEEFLKSSKDYVKKYSKTYPDLFVLKYANKVFWENSFNDALLEMRGLIMNDNNDIIIRPFKKVFNYSELTSPASRYKTEIPDDKVVKAVVKVNGFLGVCTYVDREDCKEASYNKKVLFSTTGSLDSDFAKMTEEHCAQYEKAFKDYPNHTFLFEINDVNDPHIIKEEIGETLIGIVEVKSGRQFTETELDHIAETYNMKRPLTIDGITFGELQEELKTVEHEGFMVIDPETNQVLCKLKSPFYLISKLLGRSSENSLSTKLSKTNVDEEYYPLIDYIKENQTYFSSLDEYERLDFIQEFIVNGMKAVEPEFEPEPKENDFPTTNYGIKFRM